MSHHEDKPDMKDDEFDDYLKRGSSLSRRYKQVAQDEVPAELDQKILSQARESLKDKSDSKVVTHPSWWTKWNKPLALAATLLLAVTVIYKVGDRSIDKLAAPEATIALKQNAAVTAAEPAHADSANRVAEESVAGAASAHEQTEVKEEPKEPPSLAPPRDVPLQSIKQSVPAPQVSFAAPAAAPASPPIAQEMEKDKAATSGALAKSSERPAQDTVTDSVAASDIGTLPDASVTESLQRIPGLTMTTREQRGAAPKKESPANAEELLQHIRELRKQGRDKEAMKAWKQFRKAFPDYPVAEDDAARSNKR